MGLWLWPWVHLLPASLLKCTGTSPPPQAVTRARGCNQLLERELGCEGQGCLCVCVCLHDLHGGHCPGARGPGEQPPVLTSLLRAQPQDSGLTRSSPAASPRVSVRQRLRSAGLPPSPARLVTCGDFMDLLAEPFPALAACRLHVPSKNTCCTVPFLCVLRGGRCAPIPPRTHTLWSARWAPGLRQGPQS